MPRIHDYTDLPEKWAAERAAARVAGVTAVASELEVRLASSSERTDEDIARAALDALRWNPSVPSHGIRVLVSHGWVTLEGTVDWRYQKDAAEDATRNLIGVRGVSNFITVRPAVSATNVKAGIEAALRRSAEIDASLITVETNGNKVTLRWQRQFVVGTASGGARDVGGTWCFPGEKSHYRESLDPGRQRGARGRSTPERFE